MDRFKFRVWDKERKCFFNDDEVVLYPNGEESYFNADYDFAETVIEQCTSLKDKNGKLIYEGDIIELTRARNYGYIPRGSRLVIKWNTFDCCGFSTGIRGNLTKKCADNCIVVGNIHENADLLGEE